MSDWIERYRGGECAVVWEEMQALGQGIRKPAYRKAASAVVKETMQRARKNALTLLEALPTIGYRFAAAPEPAAPDYLLELRLQSALAYVRRHGGAKGRANPFGHQALAWVEDEEIELPAEHLGGRPGRANYRPPSARTAELLEAVEHRRGAPLAMAVRAWFETVGSVDLAGSHPILNRGGEVTAMRVFVDQAAEIAGSDAGAEFVAGLRHAFEWGGFPGWAERTDAPERELTWLRGKLLPL
jgi:hypothetical protein